MVQEANQDVELGISCIIPKTSQQALHSVECSCHYEIAAAILCHIMEDENATRKVTAKVIAIIKMSFTLVAVTGEVCLC